MMKLHLRIYANQEDSPYWTAAVPVSDLNAAADVLNALNNPNLQQALAEIVGCRPFKAVVEKVI